MKRGGEKAGLDEGRKGKGSAVLGWEVRHE